jgi:hypothetical protein
MRVGVHICKQSSSSDIFLLLRNEGKATLAEELEKEAARITGAELEDVLRQSDKVQAFRFGLVNEVCLDSLEIEYEESPHVLKIR